MRKIKSIFNKYKEVKSKQEHLLAFRKAQNYKIKPNTILFESLHGKSIDGHIFHIIKSLNKKKFSNYKIYVAVRDIQSAKKKLDSLQMENVFFTKHMSGEYGKLLATCEYLINDNTFYPFYSKRSGQKYYNIWHGTPLKTLGKDMEDKLGIANVQRNFLMSDGIIFSNEYTKNIMIDAHNINNIYNGKVIVGPSPRNTALLNNNIAQKTKAKFGLNEKKIVVYMPTWRGTQDKVRSDNQKVYNDLTYLSRNIDKNTIIFFKPHTMQSSIDLKELPQIKLFPDDCELYDFLSCADILITDYSSIMYDFLNKDKKIILFAYDKEEYFETRGVYEDIEKYPFCIVNTVEKLAEEINKNDFNIEYTDMKNRFCELDSIDGAEIITNYIFNNKNDGKIKEYKVDNGKENVFIFTGGLWDNGITTALLNNINSIDTSKRNYILVFGKNKVSKNHIFRLANLPENVLYYPITGISIESLFERFIHKNYLNIESLNFTFVKNIVRNIYKREIRRVFGDTRIDWFIHYTGFDRKYAELVEYMPANTAMFVHTDMFEDYKNKKNYNRKVVYGAYKAATKIVLVNKNLRNGFEVNLPSISHKLEVVNNFLGENRIKEMSNEDLISSLNGVKFDSVDSSHIHLDPVKEYLSLNTDKQKGISFNDQDNSYLNLKRNQDIARIERSIMKNIEGRFDNISDFFVKEKVLSSGIFHDYIINEINRLYLEDKYSYRMEMVDNLMQVSNLSNEQSVKFVNEILRKHIKINEARKAFPYFMTYLDQYKEDTEYYNKFVRNGVVDDYLKEITINLRDSVEKLSDNDFVLESIINKFGISKMRMINDVMNPEINVFMNIGRYDLQKGQDRLVNAFEKYNAEDPDSRLIIVAPYGPIKSKIVKMIKTSSAKKNIYLLGRMDNPYPLLKMVDAFVLSSYYEGLGLVVYEALALETDVITTNLETTTEYLDGSQAIIVDNSTDGIYKGFVAYSSGQRPEGKFDFENYKNKSIKEFEGIFAN